MVIRNGVQGQVLPEDGFNDDLQGRKEERGLVLGPDGQYYRTHTKTVSGLRPKAFDSRTERQESEESEADPELVVHKEREVESEDSGKVGKGLQTKQDVERILAEVVEGSPTIPDIGALLEQVQQYDLSLEESSNRNTKNAETVLTGGDPSSLTETELAALQLVESESVLEEQVRSRWLPLALNKEIRWLEDNRRSGTIPWWRSNSSLVRLWGQLNCGFQVFNDVQLVMDLVDVLGKDCFDLDSSTKDEITVFAFMGHNNNADSLKKTIRAKYPDLSSLFDAIIRTLDK